MYPPRVIMETKPRVRHCFCAGGRSLVTVSVDNRIRLWDVVRMPVAAARGHHTAMPCAPAAHAAPSPFYMP